MPASPAPPELLGQSPVFLDVLAHASAAAVLDRPVLIVGERGSGKEPLAERIHFLSPRWEGPFLKVNCAALTDELLDSELFGHETGAFTGAARRHLGRFERAEGGTLFLDEIASASMRVQEKLLRIIEYGEYERVGGEETLNADVRVIAAANVDLQMRAAAGRFRADLLDRLAFDVIAAPPLRARKEDIPLLAAHFAATLAAELDAGFDGFAPEAMAAFTAHDWPGNVRELKNAAERSFYRWRADERDGSVGEALIDPFENVRLEPAEPSADGAESQDTSARTYAALEPSVQPFDLRAHLDAAEKDLVERALGQHDGNQRRAAEHLSLTYDQMRGLVRKYGLAPRRRRRMKKTGPQGAG
ncbi:MAG: phage shock protein operon transcriptional activator [Parvularculaceae bacterium]